MTTLAKNLGQTDCDVWRFYSCDLKDFKWKLEGIVNMFFGTSLEKFPLLFKIYHVKSHVKFSAFWLPNYGIFNITCSVWKVKGIFRNKPKTNK